MCTSIDDAALNKLYAVANQCDDRTVVLEFGIFIN